MSRTFSALTLAAALFFAASVSKAGTITRSISLSWEPIPDSSGYELELTRHLEKGQKSKPLIFKSKVHRWTGKIIPGRYTMRIRSIDDRGVPGDWNDPAEIVVPLPATTLLEPKEKASIQSDQVQNHEVSFQWAPVPGASRYRIEIFAEDGSPIHSAEVSHSPWKYTLPVAKSYKWTVTPISENAIPGDTVSAPANFTLIGKAPDTPIVEKPESRFSNKVTWSKPDHADTFDYVLSRKDKDGRWKVVERKTGVKENFINFDPKAPGGNFRLHVRTRSKLRQSSKASTMEFYIHEGDRSPAAVETLMLKESIEKEKDNFLIATYFLSNLNYQGHNKELGGNVNYNTIGGTGRLGYGYMPKGQWGFIGSIDVSGVILNGTNNIFTSGEATAVYRTYLDDLTQFRTIGGFGFNEIPEARGLTSEHISVSNITQAGPIIGAQIWRPLSYRFGLQLNAKAQMALFKLSTPNNEDVVPTLSYQLGALASYRLSSDLMGFAGIAYRQDRATYKARPYSGGTELNFAKPGDENEVTMTGTYLNLLLEWGF